MGKKRNNKSKKSNNNNKANKKKEQKQQQQQQQEKNAPGPVIIIQKIRHSDPKTRHAALTALLHTKFCTSTTTTNNNNNKISIELLNIIRDQICNYDIHCSSTASACLGNYLATTYNNNNNNNNNDSITAGWILIFIKRLHDCYNKINNTTTTTNNNTNNNNETKNILPWLELTERCLYGLIQLIENNPLSIEHLIINNANSNNNNNNNYIDCIQLISNILQESNKQIVMITTAAAAAAMDNNNTNKNNNQQELITMYSNIQTLSTRFFHSIWDDNETISILLQSTDKSQLLLQSTLQIIYDTMTHQNNSNNNNNNNNYYYYYINIEAKLHSAGTWINVWRSINNNNTNNEKTTIQLVLEQHISNAVTIIIQALSLWNNNNNNNNNNNINTIIQNLNTAYKEYIEQLNDNQLDRDIISKQDKKKEPARLIARRLKQQKEKQEKEKQQQDVVMEEDDNDDDNDKKNENNSNNKTNNNNNNNKDKKEIWDKAISDWYDITIRPIQLSLEIIANLTTPKEEEIEDDIMMHDDDQQQQQQQQPVLSDAVLKLIIDNQLPDRVYDTFKQLMTWMNNNNNNDKLPNEIIDTISDLQCKVLVCIRHCLSNILSWEPTCNNNNNNIWNELKIASTTIQDENVKEAIIATMVIAIRSRSNIRTEQIQNDDLQYILSLLSSSNNNTNQYIIRDAICMLGILCSQESHPIEVNEMVCKTLLNIVSFDTTSTAISANDSHVVVLNDEDDKNDKKKVGQSSSSNNNNDDNNNNNNNTMVITEILSVLMDIYGNDECYPNIFEKYSVLEYFQKIIPIVKEKIVLDELTKQYSMEDIENYKEIIMNANRFIVYKKEQKQQTV